MAHVVNTQYVKILFFLWWQQRHTDEIFNEITQILNHYNCCKVLMVTKKKTQKMESFFYFIFYVCTFSFNVVNGWTKTKINKLQEVFLSFLIVNTCWFNYLSIWTRCSLECDVNGMLSPWQTDVCRISYLIKTIDCNQLKLYDLCVVKEREGQTIRNV